jgi:uncharacterized repeat protein (TIGR02543 family)
MVFRGWATTDSYDANTTPLDIDGVRAFISNRLNNENLTASVTVQHIYAMVFYVHKVTFLDELGVILTEDDALSRTPGEMSYTIKESYTPIDQDDCFEGWLLVSGEGNISAPADGRENYVRNEIVTLSGDVVLEPFLPAGNWLIFDENGAGASYTGPQFIRSGQHPTKPTDPVRLGYTFAGWYSSQECFEDDLFKDSEFNNELTGKTKLYAGWIAVTSAPYTVIIWKQNISGEGYDFARSIQKSGYVGNTIDIVSSSGTGNSIHAVVDGEHISYEGFHLHTYNTGIRIVPEGNSILNVYYNRDIITMDFYVYNSNAQGNDIYEETSDITGTQYGLVEGVYYQLSYEDGMWYYILGENGYIVTTSDSPEPQQYGYVNGTYVKLYRIDGKWQYENGGYDYIATNNEYEQTPEQYGRYKRLATGYFPLQYVNGQWMFDDERWGTGMHPYPYDGGFLSAGATESTRYLRQPSYSVYGNGRTRYIYVDGRVPYTGIRYKLIEANSKWELYYTAEGLYGQSLTEQGYIWPTDYGWYDEHTSSGGTGGTHTTFLDAFLPSGEGVSQLIFYGRANPSGTKTVKFYKQNEQQTDYVLADTVNVSGTSFNISDKYTGFVAYQYSVDGGTRQNVGTYDPETGYYGDAVSYNSTLEIYFNRLAKDITYMDGTYFYRGTTPLEVTARGKLGEVKNIIYGSDISGYADSFVPTYTGYVFAGWYVDDRCSIPYEFTTMPEGGVTVFAKWIEIEYRVFLHSCVPADETVDWGGQEMSFRVRYNDFVKGSMIEGIRDDYNIVGWFYDEDYNDPFIFETRLTDGTVTTTYDKTRTSEVDDHGNPLGTKALYEDGKYYVWKDDDWYRVLNEDTGVMEMVLWNKDESRFWITRSLDLYAKWRSKIDGAKGINIEYYNGDNEVYTDPSLYLDQAQAIGYATPPAAANEGEEFKYWVVLHWNGSAYVVPESDAQHVLPEAGFTVYKADAKDEDYTDPTDPDVTKKYTIRLMAVFGPIESETTTKLVYNGNGGTLVSGWTYPEGYPAAPTVNDNVITFTGLTINQEYPQLGEVFTKPGYKFLGWSTDSSATAPQFAADQHIAPDILNSEVNTLYAVWEEKTITINYVAKGPVGAENFGSVSPAAESGPVKVFSGTASGSTATAGDGFKFVGWYSDENCETLVSENAEFVPQKDGDPAHYPYESETLTYYAKFEFDTTTLTITNSTGHDAIFTVSGKGYSALVLAIPNEKSLTIANVYVGETYTVTEDGGWSWRYTPYTGATEPLIAGGNSFDIEAVLNALITSKWLSGTSWAWKYDPTLYGVSN